MTRRKDACNGRRDILTKIVEGHTINRIKELLHGCMTEAMAPADGRTSWFGSPGAWGAGSLMALPLGILGLLSSYPNVGINPSWKIP
jgi:hypothetical protein